MKVIEAQEYPAISHLTLATENTGEASLLGRLLLKSTQKIEAIVAYPKNGGAPELQIHAIKNKNKEHVDRQTVGSGRQF